MEFTLFFISTTPPSITAILTTLTKGSVSIEGTVTLRSGLQITGSTAEVLKITDVPEDRFAPNIPGIGLKISSVPNDHLSQTFQILILKISSVPDGQFVPSFTGTCWL